MINNQFGQSGLLGGGEIPMYVCMVVAWLWVAAGGAVWSVVLDNVNRGKVQCCGYFAPHASFSLSMTLSPF